MQNRVPWACCQVLDFYKKFSVLQYPMSKVNGQSVADREKHVGGTHPRKKKKKMFHVKHGPVACCLWTTLVGCGACLWAGPTLIFYLCLRAGGILPALCSFLGISILKQSSSLLLPRLSINSSHLRTYAFDKSFLS